MHPTSTLLLTVLLASASCVMPCGDHATTHHERAAVCARCGDDEHAPVAHRGPPPFEHGPGRDGAGPDGRFGREGGPAGRPPHGPPPFARGERGGPERRERDGAGTGRPDFAPREGFARDGEGPRGRPPFEQGREQGRGPGREQAREPGRGSGLGPDFGPGRSPRGGPEGGPGRRPGGPRMELRPPAPDEIAAVLRELELTPEQRARADAQLAELRAHARPQPGAENTPPGRGGPEGRGAPDGRPGPDERNAPGAGPRRGPQVWREILGDEAFERFREKMRARHERSGPPDEGGAGPRRPHAPRSV